jgi:4-amino-4-deoxy-L-arabinose transferase-like glycosyltransferase
MYRIKRLFLFESPTYLDWVIYFTAFIIIQVPAIINFYFNDGSHNVYIQMADALLHGNLYLPDASNAGDLASFHGKVYLPYPPLPAVLLMPFVLVFGAAHVNTVAVATIMACVCLYLVYNILTKLKIDREYIIWIIAAVFFGTGFWYALFTSHHVYAFAHITSFMFQLLIINELLGKRRWWLTGLFIGCSFLTRQFTIVYVIFAGGYMYYVSRTETGSFTIKNILSLLSPVGMCASVYLFYNYLRFGNPLDSGYQHINFIGVLKERVDHYGVFSIKYFLFNLYSTLIKGFNIEFQGNTYLNIKDMDLWGTSLLAASPFFIASVKAEWPKILRISAWATIIVILVGQLFYHNNGFEQVNSSRFTLDFLPLLLLLMALGISKIPLWLVKAMISYGVLLNVVSFIIHLLYQR